MEALRFASGYRGLLLAGIALAIAAFQIHRAYASHYLDTPTAFPSFKR
jgi:hypothetical protein